MPYILFVDTNLDWSNFSVAGNMRAKYGAAKTPVEMIFTCNVSGLDPSEELFLSAHGAPTSSGNFTRSDDLAKALEKGGLKKAQQKLVLLSCSSAVNPAQPNQNCFASDLKQSMSGLGYKSITVEGGTGFVVVFPAGQQVVVKQMGGPALEKQLALEKKYASELQHCKQIVATTLGDPKPAALAKAVDEVAVTLIPFYADLLKDFQPFLKDEAYAFKKF
jgi:hypothetical protein